MISEKSLGKLKFTKNWMIIPDEVVTVINEFE